MATKRKLVIRNPEPMEPELPEEPKRSWLKRVYAKYWFVLAAIVLITFVPLELMGHEEWGDLRWPASFIFIAGVLVLFAILFLKIWGRDGVWGEE
jgi:polyferredoxin